MIYSLSDRILLIERKCNFVRGVMALFSKGDIARDGIAVIG